MDYNEFYDVVFDYVARGSLAINNSYYHDSLRQLIVETACDVEKAIDKERGGWDETPICDDIIEEAWDNRTRAEMNQPRLSSDDVTYTAILDEDRKVLVDGCELSEFIKNYRNIYITLRSIVSKTIACFEGNNENALLSEKGNLYETYCDTYEGHVITVKRKIA